MEKIGLFKAISLTSEYQKMLPRDRIQLRKKRLFDLVTYARENSPLYAGHYEDLIQNFTLRDLMPTTREMFYKNYDAWSTDREVTLSGLLEYLSDEQNNDCFLGKYYVSANNGSDSERLITLMDKNCARLMSVGYMFNCFARREHFWSFMVHGQRAANLYTTQKGFFNCAFVKMRMKYLPFRKRKSILLSSQNSTSSLVNSLNEFRPSMLAGYPSVLTRMADEKKAGRLKISPSFIMADGEPLEEATRKKLEETFGCDVTSSYDAALTGCMAYECREHHLHINDDWIIIEPVDRNGNPVAPGKTSDKILVTNLANYAQPVIRCELLDRIILHEEECLCGNPAPWIEVLGRTLDQLKFMEGGEEIVIPIAELDAVLRNEDYIKRYQILVYPNNLLELRLSGNKGVDRTMAFLKAEKVLRSYLKSIGIIAPMITLNKDAPKPDPLSGKYQTIITM